MTPTANAPHISHEAEMEDASDSDGAESIFSQASLASTATTMSLGGIRASTGDLITNLISDLLCTKEMNAINLTALKDPDNFGSERYRRNVRRLVKAFGQDLRAEASGSMQSTAARALQTRRVSTHAARELVTRSEALNNSPNEASAVKIHRVHAEPSEEDAASDASVDSADEDDEDEQPTDENLTRIRDFLLASKAYVHLKDRLVTFAHQPYGLRISRAFGGKAFGDSGRELDPRPLKAAVEEISWVPVHLFTFQEPWSFRLSVLDRLKGLIEDKMDEQWNWWPMGSRLHTLRLDCYRLQWKSPCGTPHHLDLPLETLEPLQAALSTAPDFLNAAPAPSAKLIEDLDAKCQSPDPGRSSRLILRLNSVVSAWGLPKTTHSSIALDSNVQRAHIMLSPPPAVVDAGLVSPASSSAGQATLQPHDFSQRSGTSYVPASLTIKPPRKSSYLYLCIRLLSFRFQEIECGPLKTDLELFQAFKSAYDQPRGFLRRWFSVWKYDHCEFFVFQKWGVRLGGPLHLGFPLNSDLLYDFEPRPPMPPESPAWTPVGLSYLVILPATSFSGASTLTPSRRFPKE